MALEKNRVRYGLKNAHYAVVDLSGDEPVFGTPKKLPGAVSITREAQGDASDFYADDEDYFSRYSNNGYEGTLEMALIPDEFSIDCLGMTMDADGCLVERSGDQASEFALLFEFTGDKKAIRHCLYYCTASRPNQDGETKGESIEPKTEELSFKALPLPGSDGLTSRRSSAETDEDVYDAWYDAVQLPTELELTTTPASAEYEEEDVAITVDGGTVDSIKLNGVALGSTAFTVSGSTVTLKSTYLDTLAAGTHRFKLYAGEKLGVFTLTIA